MKQDEVIDGFIGEEFITPRGSTLTITELLPREKYNDGKLKGKMYKLVCAECNKDSELYGEYFTTKRYNLQTVGNIPCGCSGIYRYSKEQSCIRVQRLCEDRGYTFLGFCSWDGYKTKLRLHCSKHGMWDSTSMECFMKDTGCPSCGYDKVGKLKRYSISDHIKVFQDSYPEGTKFEIDESLHELDKPYKHWIVTCPLCTEDNLYKAGLCNGKFKVISSALKSGKTSCRCSKHYSYTKVQREFQIQELMIKREGIFEGWEDGYTNAQSKVQWFCKQGHLCSHPVAGLIRGTSNCYECAQNDFGLYKHRLQDPDNMYIMKFSSKEESFIKVGRSFNIKDRIKYFRYFYDVELISTLRGKHIIIHKTEQDYHTYLIGKGFHYIPDIKFAGYLQECFVLEAEDACYF